MPRYPTVNPADYITLRGDLFNQLVGDLTALLRQSFSRDFAKGTGPFGGLVSLSGTDKGRMLKVYDYSTASGTYECQLGNGSVNGQDPTVNTSIPQTGETAPTISTFDCYFENIPELNATTTTHKIPKTAYLWAYWSGSMKDNKPVYRAYLDIRFLWGKLTALWTAGNTYIVLQPVDKNGTATGGANINAQLNYPVTSPALYCGYAVNDIVCYIDVNGDGSLYVVHMNKLPVPTLYGACYFNNGGTGGSGGTPVNIVCDLLPMV